MMESFKRQKLATVNVNAGSVSANDELDVAVAVPGASLGDIAIVNVALEAGLAIGGAWVSDVDEVTVKLLNPTASPIDPAAVDFHFALIY